MSRAGSLFLLALPQTRLDRSSLIRLIRLAKRSMLAPASQMSPLIRKQAWAFTNQPTPDRPGLCCPEAHYSKAGPLRASRSPQVPFTQLWRVAFAAIAQFL